MPPTKNAALAIIPARGGSKRLPGKNLVALGGRPLIAYTIDAALECVELDRVAVTTDDPAIAAAVRDLGARVIMRPPDLATDNALLGPVCEHALREVEGADDRRYDVVVLLQPTSPFRRAHHIRAALKLLRTAPCDSVMSVCPSQEAPERARVIVDGWLRFADPAAAGEEARPRADRPSTYQANGAIYAAYREVLLERHDLRGERIAPLIMTPEESIDIDTVLDLRLAEAVLEHGKERSE